MAPSIGRTLNEPIVNIILYSSLALNVVGWRNLEIVGTA